jgi:hypothetical protein
MLSTKIPLIEGLDGLDCTVEPTNGNTVTYSSNYLNTCIFDKYNNIIVNKQRDIDEKLMELEKSKDSIYVNDSQGLYKHDILIGITTTILGSCVLYYILSKIAR